MENKNLMQDMVEKWGEETQMDMIIEKCLLLATAMQKIKRIERKEDYKEYSRMYHEVCERIADMRLMVEQAEFLFNTNEIREHYENKLLHFNELLNDF